MISHILRARNFIFKNKFLKRSLPCKMPQAFLTSHAAPRISGATELRPPILGLLSPQADKIQPK
jgi:hypothetical protein